MDAQIRMIQEQDDDTIKRHEKILKLKRLMSSDPIDWEDFLELDKDLQAVITPSFKCSFEWLLRRYPPSSILCQLLKRYESYLFSSKQQNQQRNNISIKDLRKCIKTACCLGNVDFIRFVAWKDKRLLSQPFPEELYFTKYGNLPIHCAYNLEMARILVEAYPQGLRVANQFGQDLPIHKAIWHNKSVEHVKFLVIEGKKQGLDHGGLLRKDSHGHSPFSILCEQIEKGIDVANLTFPLYSDDLKLWEKLLFMLEEIYSSNTQQLGVDFKVVHALIESGCPNQAILMGLMINPVQIRQMDQFGRYPLSLCASQPSATNPKSTLLKILHSYPDAIRIPDYNGRLCLHWAAMGGRKLRDGMEDILNAYPGALRLADKDGMLPFMLGAASETDSSLDLVYQLIRECPEYFSYIS